MSRDTPQTVYHMIRPTLRRTIAGTDRGIGSGRSCRAMFGLPDHSDDVHGCANLQLALESTHSERGGHGDLLLTCHPGSCSRLLCPSCLRWLADVLRDLQHGGVCPFIWCGCLFADAAVVEQSCWYLLPLPHNLWVCWGIGISGNQTKKHSYTSWIRSIAFEATTSSQIPNLLASGCKLQIPDSALMI